MLTENIPLEDVLSVNYVLEITHNLKNKAIKSSTSGIPSIITNNFIELHEEKISLLLDKKEHQFLKPYLLSDHCLINHKLINYRLIIKEPLAQLNNESNVYLGIGINANMAQIFNLSKYYTGRIENFFAILHSDYNFPFNPVPSKWLVPNIEPGCIAGAPLLEDLDIPNRLSNFNNQAGCATDPILLCQQICQHYLTPNIPAKKLIILSPSTNQKYPWFLKLLSWFKQQKIEIKFI